jgi:hypothetical protein
MAHHQEQGLISFMVLVWLYVLMNLSSFIIQELSDLKQLNILSLNMHNK